MNEPKESVKMSKIKMMRHDPSDFNKGDKVAVIHKVKAANGWNNDWADDMDKAMFQTLTVKSTDEFGIYFDEAITTSIHGTKYGFPSCSCILVASVEHVKQQTKKEPKVRTAQDEELSLAELQVLQEILRGYLHLLNELDNETKQNMQKLWPYCDPDRSHHTDVQIAYKTLNEQKNVNSKVKQWKDKLGTIQNKIKYKLGNPK